MVPRPFAIISDRLVFTDGESFPYPPADQDGKDAILAKLASTWKPLCKSCGSTQTPIIRSDNRIVAMCLDCNHLNMLIRSYAKMSDEELASMEHEIYHSAKRRLKAVKTVVARRKEMAGNV